jgi:hypothetical protein
VADNGEFTGREAVIVEAARLPVGRGHEEKGYYKDVHASSLLAKTYASVIERAGIEAAEGQEERPEQQEVHDDEQVAHTVEGQRHRDERDEERDAHGADEDHVGNGAEQPRRVGRDQDLLGEQFPQLEIRLPEGRAAAVLEPRLEQADEAHERWRDRQRENRLAEFDEEAGHGSHRAAMSRTSRAAQRYARYK